jgi:hypothetical protein
LGFFLFFIPTIYAKKGYFTSNFGNACPVPKNLYLQAFLPRETFLWCGVSRKHSKLDFGVKKEYNNLLFFESGNVSIRHLVGSNSAINFHFMTDSESTNGTFGANIFQEGWK